MESDRRFFPIVGFHPTKKKKNSAQRHPDDLVPAGNNNKKIIVENRRAVETLVHQSGGGIETDRSVVVFCLCAVTLMTLEQTGHHIEQRKRVGLNRVGSQLHSSSSDVYISRRASPGVKGGIIAKVRRIPTADGMCAHSTKDAKNPVSSRAQVWDPFLTFVRHVVRVLNRFSRLSQVRDTPGGRPLTVLCRFFPFLSLFRAKLFWHTPFLL